MCIFTDFFLLRFRISKILRNFATMKFRKTYLTILILLCITGTAVGQLLQPTPGRKRAVYGVGYYVSRSDYDYSSTAHEIVAGAATRYDKAQRIYLWLCRNITYDRTGQIRTADETFRRRTAVCQGYCELFYRLGECVGLKSRLVYGKCRRPNGSFQEHVWLLVTTEKGDILLDPTWGAGYYRGDRFVRQQEPLKWFDVDPAWFVFTHLPKSDSRQNLYPPVTQEQFAQLRFVTPPSATDEGVNAHDSLTHALAAFRPLPLPTVRPAVPTAVPADSLDPDVISADSVENDILSTP